MLGSRLDVQVKTSVSSRRPAANVEEGAFDLDLAVRDFPDARQEVA